MGHEYFAEVSEDFIEDDFNLTGLGSQVALYKEALEMILDVEPDDASDDYEDEDDDEDDESMLESRPRRPGRVDGNMVETSAELLYGLIHQRYIISRPGIQQMHEKYEATHFGFCPRVFCNACKVIPVGSSDTPGMDTVKLFCPSCLDIYTPPNTRFQNVDGAFFGTTFASLFFMTFPDLQFNPNHPLVSPTSSQSDVSPYRPSTQPNQPIELNGTTLPNFAPGTGASNIYEPRIFGFRVSERSRTGPRMQWLRSKPDDMNELNEAARYHSEYGGSEDPIDEDDEAPDPPQTTSQQARVDGRKKAPMRRRRRISSEEAQMDPGGLNGVG